MLQENDLKRLEKLLHAREKNNQKPNKIIDLKRSEKLLHAREKKNQKTKKNRLEKVRKTTAHKR